MPTARAKRNTTWAGVRVLARGDAGNQRMAQDLRVRREQREPLVDDASLRAERPHGAVPSAAGEAAILDERGGLGAGGLHLLQVIQGHIADAEEPCAARIALLPHRQPDQSVVVGPGVARGGAVQHVAVDVVGLQVLERARHRLGHLRGHVGLGVVGKPVVLTIPVRELRLQKEIRARHQARAIGRGEALTDSRLEVVPPLIGGVDRPKAHPERELGQGRGSVLLPGGPVEEVGNRHGAMRRHQSLRGMADQPISARIFSWRCASASMMASTVRAPAWKMAVALSATQPNPIVRRATTRPMTASWFA